MSTRVLYNNPSLQIQKPHDMLVNAVRLVVTVVEHCCSALCCCCTYMQALFVHIHVRLKALMLQAIKQLSISGVPNSSIGVICFFRAQVSYAHGESLVALQPHASMLQ